MPKKPNYMNYLLNCLPSKGVETDWNYSQAVSAGVAKALEPPPAKDLREGNDWWTIRDQKATGACVGFATADGVLRWHLVTAKRILPQNKPSPRFIWMASKETDEDNSYPTTFIELAGTFLKQAIIVAQKFGCVLEKDLAMKGGLYPNTPEEFYAKAARLRISSYHNLGRDLKAWRTWLANQGPILTRLDVDRTWDEADKTKGVLKTFQPSTTRGGHAVCLVGYTPDYFIVRNSWGDKWGDKGFAYAYDEYAAQAFSEAYGVIL